MKIKRKKKNSTIVSAGKNVPISFDNDTSEPMIHGTLNDVKKLFFKEFKRIPLNDDEIKRFIFWIQVEAAHTAGFGDKMPDIPKSKIAPVPMEIRKR